MPSIWVLCTLITPRLVPPTMIGTPRYDRACLPMTMVPRSRPCRSVSRLMMSGLPALLILLVGELDDPGMPVEQRDVSDVGLENRADLLAHQLEQVGEVELARELL